MADFYCINCGTKSSSAASLTGQSCSRHPLGPSKGKHILYEGSAKSQYVCKFCGSKSSTIASLTGQSCSRHPLGPSKGKHSPAV